jgi:membrane-associated phospholipid phosphatase
LIHAHWFSDVIAGAAVGFFVTLFLWQQINARQWISLK